jgi:two-component system NtrC family sensor kinase
MTVTRWLQRLRVRHKLLAMALLPLVLLLPLMIALLWWANAAFDRLLISKVQADLAVAQGYVERVLDGLRVGTAAAAESHALHLALARAAEGGLVPLLIDVKARAGMDFIGLRAPDGTLLATDSGLATQPDRDAAMPPQGASIEVLGPDQLARLGRGLRERAAVPLLPTAGAAPTDRTREDRALVMLARHPVRAPDGRLLGHLQGGMLLNHNLRFIDHVNAIVYPDDSLPFGSEGTVTIFLDDVRVSTNVRLFVGRDGTRALGTRVSQAVRDAVLGRGQTWLDRAFVVNDWYVSGYRPLHDGAGARVGMLYVGYLDRPFVALKYAVLTTIGVAFLAVMAIAALISLRWARGIFRPLEGMAQTMRQVKAGALQARVGAVERADEIGQLAGDLDGLLDTIDENTRALQRWNTELDAKVAERTRELEGAKHQLVRSEKLATIGQLTASIAHEVNNPIAVIQSNLDLVRQLLAPEAATAVRPELRTIDEQIERMRLIVTQLLQFARPGEYAGYVEAVPPAAVLDECLMLVSHQLDRTRITVEREFASDCCAAVNRRELQQVLVNLLVNAIQAMPDGGVLTLGSHDSEDGGVAISVADTGPGLSPEVLGSLFQPFETHRKDGTGLGLWISRGIVERYGGDIRARNRTGEGATGAVFTVLLPADLL